jgi:cytochrome c biogenesis protein CcmG, thiol:disulfide interchange protein DsbE
MRASFGMKIFPLIALSFLLFVFALNLKQDPHQLPSVLINKPTPSFDLKTLFNNENFTNQTLQGKVSLINFFATWCYTCQKEHPLLMDIAQTPGITLYAIDYKDDTNKAQSWLNTFGNPYTLVGIDANGQTGINFGVYGTPETYLIDKTGRIRYKQIGALTPDIWKEKIYPLIQQLNAS